ncbi:MAG: hypothetical protein ACRD6W_01545 [Nitrososphaerales archaeon]
MQHELRRFLPRQFADWRGTYLIEDDPERRWRGCRVVDIVGRGRPGARRRTSGGRRGPSDRRRHHLKGEIRNAAVKGDRMRVGTQFLNLTDAERAYLDSQERLAVHW